MYSRYIQVLAQRIMEFERKSNDTYARIGKVILTSINYYVHYANRLIGRLVHKLANTRWS